MPHPAFLSAIHISANHTKPPRAGSWARATQGGAWFYTANPQEAPRGTTFHHQPAHMAQQTLAQALDDEIRF